MLNGLEPTNENALTRGIMIHGTPEQNYQYLGTPASHGCIRMKNDAVIDLATQIEQRKQQGQKVFVGVIDAPTLHTSKVTPREKQNVESKKTVLQEQDLSLKFKDKQREIESRGRTYAVSPKGARGEFQIMPATGRYYFKKLYPDKKFTYAKLAETYYNDSIRDAYISDLIKQYKSDVRKVYAAYNYGPTALNAKIRDHREDWEAHIPRETKKYLQKLLGDARTEKPKLAANTNKPTAS